MKSHTSLTQHTLNVWAVVLILWSIYRAAFSVERDSTIDEFIAKPLIFLLPLFLYIRYYEKQSFFNSIDVTLKKVWIDLFLGISVSFLFIFTAAYAHWANFGSFEIVIERLLNVRFILLHVGLAVASSISEEIVSRAFVLKRLYQDSHHKLYAILSSSILFFLLHIPILFSVESIRGAMLLQIIFTDIMLSIAVSIFYLQKRNIVIPIVIHALYNLGIYFFM